MDILFDTALQADAYRSIGVAEAVGGLLNLCSRRASLVTGHPLCAKFNTPQFTTFTEESRDVVEH
jgi:hypothetical protein